MQPIYFSKCIKGFNTKLGILAHHGKVQLQGCKARGITLKAIFLELCPFLTKKNYMVQMVHDRRALVLYMRCSCQYYNRAVIIMYLYQAIVIVTNIIIQQFYAIYRQDNDVLGQQRGPARTAPPLKGILSKGDERNGARQLAFFAASVGVGNLHAAPFSKSITLSANIFF